MRVVLSLMLFATWPALAQDCTVSPWKVERIADPMRDTATCMVVVADPREAVGGLVVTRISGDTTFSVLGAKPRLSPALIRVDDNPAIYVTEELRTSHFRDDGRKLLEQLKAGTVVRTQYGDWPSSERMDRETPICDLIAKIESCPE